jgi:DNA-binding beta-propeller fold protein YncE
VFDLKTFKELGRVPVGQNPDAIIYDPSSKKVMAFNGRGKDVTVVDPAARPGPAAVVGHVALDGKPEFAVADGEGHVYVNLEDKSAIVQIDSATMKVLATWKIDGGESPSGLAIDPANHHLFAGCDNHVMAVVDSQTGKTLGTVPIGEEVDACGFDPGTGEAFASCGDGTLTVVKESSPGKFEVEQTVHTRTGARTMALDPGAHVIYLPTAEFAEAPAEGKRPALKPDSFMLVVVSRNTK